jgi:hypothetical protein
MATVLEVESITYVDWIGETLGSEERGNKVNTEERAALIEIETEVKTEYRERNRRG